MSAFRDFLRRHFQKKTDMTSDYPARQQPERVEPHLEKPEQRKPSRPRSYSQARRALSRDTKKQLISAVGAAASKEADRWKLRDRQEKEKMQNRSEIEARKRTERASQEAKKVQDRASQEAARRTEKKPEPGTTPFGDDYLAKLGYTKVVDPDGRTHYVNPKRAAK